LEKFTNKIGCNKCRIGRANKNCIQTYCKKCCNKTDAKCAAHKSNQKDDKGEDNKEGEEKKAVGKKTAKEKTDKEKEEEQYEEPKIKWKKSEAKRLLRNDILEGRVPLYAIDEDGKRTTDLKALYHTRVEFTEYHYSKFSSRVGSLRTTLQNDTDRSILDQEAFDNYKKNHPTLIQFSHKGYIQWQGSESQRLCLKDIEDGVHERKSRVDFYASRPEYYNQFPLDAFRDKVKQEIRTAKYLYTLEVKGKDPRKKQQK